MEKEFIPQPELKVTNMDIKQQYAGMNSGQQQSPSQEDIDKQRLDMEVQLDKVLPYLRKQKEATELEMALTKMDCQLGRVHPTQVPGQFGKILEIEAMETQLSWGRLKLEQQEMALRAGEEKKKIEELQKQEEERKATATTENLA